MQAYFSTTQFGQCISTMHQDAEIVKKKLEKVKAGLQAALDANSTLEAELHFAQTIEECKDAEKKELSKKLLASKDAYLELIEWYILFLPKKEKLKKDVGVLQSSVEELTMEINHQLFLGFEIMRDTIKEIMPNFEFKRLDKITAAKATHHAQVTTLEEGEEGLEDLIMPIAPSNVLIVVEQNVQVMEGSAQGVLVITHPIRDEIALPKEHIKAKAGNDDGSEGDTDEALTHPNLP